MGTKHSPHILLLNPWITDFAAYNFWIRPFGLLYIASLLKEYGFRVTLVDCLEYDRRVKRYGDGKFFRSKIAKPDPLRSIPRHYCRYGIPEEMLLKRLSSLEGRPDLIGITSGMTYWYPGVFKLIEILRDIFPEVPVVLGGIYATLCHDHAQKHSGADVVLTKGDDGAVVEGISQLIGFPTPPPKTEPRTDLYPSFDLYPRHDYVCIATSKGCPFRCAYCASPILSKEFVRRDPFKVVDEIEYWVSRFGVFNVAFYDDALLVDSRNHFIPMMKEIIRREIQVNFHTPNALHIREIDEEVARLLFQGGFKTIRLGLETSNEEAQIETGGKVSNQDFRRAVYHLQKAGYSTDEIGVYIMAGLPGQRVEEVTESIAFVREAGAKPILVEYSPIPGTPLFEKAKRFSPYDIEKEPLFQNNTLFPCQWEGFTLMDFRRLKEKLRSGEA
ncbi:MAG: radical SAM protein [Desulfobacterota bacterium]|nr:radical SAM protein [Thermodesulfobacteriota bacterium]